MPSTVYSTHYDDGSGLVLAALSHPALEQALSAACARLAIQQAYLAALRGSAAAAPARLLLAVEGAGVEVQKHLAVVLADLLPDELEADLIELADDDLSRTVRERCAAFYST